MEEYRLQIFSTAFGWRKKNYDNNNQKPSVHKKKLLYHNYIRIKGQVLNHFSLSFSLSFNEHVHDWMTILWSMSKFIHYRMLVSDFHWAFCASHTWSRLNCLRDQLRFVHHSHNSSKCEHCYRFLFRLQTWQDFHLPLFSTENGFIRLFHISFKKVLKNVKFINENDRTRRGGDTSRCFKLHFRFNNDSTLGAAH